MKWWVGIDPGRRGAMVALSSDLDALVYRSRLSAGWASDHERLDAWRSMLEDVGGSASVAAVWVELQQVRGQQQGQARHVREAGLWCGWALAYGLHLEERRPHGGDGWRAAAGMRSSAGKAETLALVEARLPQLDTAPGRLRAPHDGLVDAAAMAYAALRVQSGVV
jgi:hypothetical protein